MRKLTSNKTFFCFYCKSRYDCESFRAIVAITFATEKRDYRASRRIVFMKHSYNIITVVKKSKFIFIKKYTYISSLIYITFAKIRLYIYNGPMFLRIRTADVKKKIKLKRNMRLFLLRHNTISYIKRTFS